MQFKLVAATVASLALSGVLAVPTENIAAREINAQNAEMSQLVTQAKQAADAEKEIFDIFGADLKQAWETNFSPEKLSTAKIPTAKDFENLKAQAKAAQQQGTTQNTNNQGTTQNTDNKDPNSIQQRDAEANAQCWPNCGNSWLDWWDFLPGSQNFYPFDLYPSYWDYNYVNYATCWGAYPFGGNWGRYYANGGINIGAGINVGLGGGLGVGVGLGIHL
ncbi:hypothetical protein CBER1_00077 [Cercospora berteroae]|uniref:Uncharacterized protein n=1 Tax=Cercospora berteroae TaxID=357750 RepID=A0A2S6CDN5_9PEZI|nr:hypothetical protein CBER1_00077 [Cercospora berteroae]